MKTDRRRDGNITSRNVGNGVWRLPECSRRQESMERYCYNVICGVPTVGPTIVAAILER